ncbi:hypothetical protein JTE90_026611 [Oedothorax gibbosus]|uniref:Uncharacterized protein n=1 Tax=Oedothorax gibbosus TaxID=931172 RepID=A0AAV6UYQ0_9ARAC|nr:hypothetical protein JTE90_026611 [Oedothorax gibbosus]
MCCIARTLNHGSLCFTSLARCRLLGSKGSTGMKRSSAAGVVGARRGGGASSKRFIESSAPVDKHRHLLFFVRTMLIDTEAPGEDEDRDAAGVWGSCGDGEGVMSGGTSVGVGLVGGKDRDGIVWRGWRRSLEQAISFGRCCGSGQRLTF